MNFQNRSARASPRGSRGRPIGSETGSRSRPSGSHGVRGWAHWFSGSPGMGLQGPRGSRIGLQGPRGSKGRPRGPKKGHIPYQRISLLSNQVVEVYKTRANMWERKKCEILQSIKYYLSTDRPHFQAGCVIRSVVDKKDKNVKKIQKCQSISLIPSKQVVQFFSNLINTWQKGQICAKKTKDKLLV